MRHRSRQGNVPRKYRKPVIRVKQMEPYTSPWYNAAEAAICELEKGRRLTDGPIEGFQETMGQLFGTRIKRSLTDRP